MEPIRNSSSIIVSDPDEGYQLSSKDVIEFEIMDAHLPGKRNRHYVRLNGFEFYNERAVAPGYGRLKIRKEGKRQWQTREFPNFLTLEKPYGGIEDPRGFLFREQLYAIASGRDKSKRRNMYLYDFSRRKLVKLWLNNFDIARIRKQKNWTPYVHDGELFLIYAFDELCILKVIDPMTGECQCIKGSPYSFNNRFGFFGGTPLLKWDHSRFVGFAHSRHPYRPVPIAFNAKKMSIEKVFSPISFELGSEIRPFHGRKVQFPYHLEIDDESITLGLTFDDRGSINLKIDYQGFCKQFRV